MIKNYGFQQPKIEADQYIFGGFTKLGKEILQPDGNWEAYLPTYERQFNGNFDTYGCTIFATLNAIETLLKRLNGKDYDFSERYNYILAKIKPPGADPHVVMEAVRSYKVIPQADLPMTDRYEDFIQPDPMTKELLKKGEEWGYDFKHDWVFTNNPDTKTKIAMLKEALLYSPVPLSVTAWKINENGLYVDGGQPNGHLCELFKIAEYKGIKDCMFIFDTYDGNNPAGPSGSIKILHPDHRIQVAKRIEITPSTKQLQISIIQKLLIAIKELLGLVQKENVIIKEMETPIEKPVEKKDYITPFCLAIQDREGYFPPSPKYPKGSVSWRNKNPGNCKDINGNFINFSTYEVGFAYLKNYVERACTGRHKAYKPDMTILQFFNVYAPAEDNNEPLSYANEVAKKIGLSTMTKIKDLL